VKALYSSFLVRIWHRGHEVLKGEIEQTYGTPPQDPKKIRFLGLDMGRIREFMVERLTGGEPPQPTDTVQDKKRT